MRLNVAETRFFVIVFGLGVALRLMTVFAIDAWLHTKYGVGLLPNSDEVTYYDKGLRIATLLKQNGSISEEFQCAEDPHIGYYVLVGVLLFLKADPLQLRALNATLSLLVPVLLVLIVREAGLGTVGQKAAFLLAMFWPSSIFWTSLIIKEAVTGVLIALVLLISSRCFARRSVTCLEVLAFASGVSALFFFRAYAALLILGILTLIALPVIYGRAKVFVMILGVGALVAVLPFASELFKLTSRVLGYCADSGLSSLQHVQSSSATGGSAIPIGTPLPLKLFYFLTFPLPWQAETSFQRLAVPEVLVFLALVPIIVYGTVVQVRSKCPIAVQMICVPVAFLCVYLVIVHNLGTLYRIKTQLMIYFIYFAAAGCHALNERLQWNKGDSQAGIQTDHEGSQLSGPHGSTSPKNSSIEAARRSAARSLVK